MAVSKLAKLSVSIRRTTADGQWVWETVQETEAALIPEEKVERAFDVAAHFFSQWTDHSPASGAPPKGIGDSE